MHHDKLFATESSPPNTPNELQILDRHLQLDSSEISIPTHRSEIVPMHPTEIHQRDSRRRNNDVHEESDIERIPQRLTRHSARHASISAV